MCLTVVDGAHIENLCFNFHKSSHENVSMLWAKASSHVSRECVSGFYLRVNLFDFYSCKEQCLWSLIFIFLLSFFSHICSPHQDVDSWSGCRHFSTRRWLLGGPLTPPGLSCPSAPAICGRERERMSCHTRLLDSPRAESHSYLAVHNQFICIAWGQDLRLFDFFSNTNYNTGEALGLTWGTASPCIGMQEGGSMPRLGRAGLCI